MGKNATECFLCGKAGKTRKFTFYSGIVKGGTTSRLLTVTVTFLERWSELTMHEIQVCRDCQLRLWRQKQFLPAVLFGCAAGAVALLGAVALILLSGAAWYAVLALTVVAVLVLGGLFVMYLRQYLAGKPELARLEPLVLQEALANFPDSDHTFMTAGQYLERADKGIFG